MQFADFIRYSFRSHGQFVTMAEEIRLVDTYLDLERARFGDRLEVTLRVAPEVLSVMLPPFVLQPLVENAVHHGLEPSGRPGHLEITITDADTDAEVSVEDDGVGAEPGQIRRALAGDRRRRGSRPPQRRRAPANGLRRRVAPHRRDGSWRRHPCDHADPQVPRRGPLVTSGLSVLAVDDETPALDELVYLLTHSDMASHVRAVSSATDALHHLHHERFDVVLLDIAMPGMDGLELARVVAQFSHPPAIVFVTAHEEHALAAFDVGGSGYLLKPVTQERLVTALRQGCSAAPG